MTAHSSLFRHFEARAAANTAVVVGMALAVETLHLVAF